MDPDLPITDYRTRRGQLSAYGRAWNSSRKLWWLQLGAGIFLAVLSLLLILNVSSSSESSMRGGLLLLLLGIFGCQIAVWTYTKRHFIEPDLAFRKWLQQVCDGDLHARIDLPESHWHHKELNFHTRNLANALMKLSTDMENLVESQTRRLEYQKSVLSLLFQITNDVAAQTEQPRVLDTVCTYLANWFGDAEVTAYEVRDQGLKKLASGHSGSASGNRTAGDAAALQALLPELEKSDALITAIRYDESPLEGFAMRARVPFYEGKRVAGLLVVDAGESTSMVRKDADKVLTTVSEQLTLFVTKTSALEQAHNARLQNERNMLAADIHDSLAQTLLATRYQVTLLRESLEKQTADNVLDDVRKIESTIAEANQEIRGLIHEYRSELASHRSADSIQAQIEQFRKRTGMSVFFQLEDPQIRFTPREEAVVQRIIGEVLTNAQKYSEANMIRVFLKYRPTGVRLLLIEDDGIGFDMEAMNARIESGEANLGNHIGLSIMQERALGIGAVLTIDSEPGEGTRVSLELPPLARYDGG